MICVTESLCPLEYKTKATKTCSDTCSNKWYDDVGGKYCVESCSEPGFTFLAPDETECIASCVTPDDLYEY